MVMLIQFDVLAILRFCNVLPIASLISFLASVREKLASFIVVSLFVFLMASFAKRVCRFACKLLHL